jgi:glycosyltransferase involved in cell wall biosynthesis
MIPSAVSVIIPAYNAQATMAEALKAVLAQTAYCPIQVIVVDDGSTDNTAAIIKRFPSVKYIYQDNQGPASARNRGAAAASGDVFIFTDSDCCPEPKWITKMIAGFSDPSIGAVAGSYSIANPGERLARVIHGEIRFRHLRLMPEFTRAFGSYNVAIHAGFFRQSGGFNSEYRRASGEDNDLSYRLLQEGLRIRFCKSACVAHYHQHKLARYLREQFRHGFWRVRLYLDHLAMIGGDDYTFWKDMLEVPLAIIHLAGFFWLPFFFIMLCGFLLSEISFGIWLHGFSSDGLYAGLVMWLRAFARAAGLISGGVYFYICRIKNAKRS